MLIIQSEFPGGAEGGMESIGHLHSLSADVHGAPFPGSPPLGAAGDGWGAREPSAPKSIAPTRFGSAPCVGPARLGEMRMATRTVAAAGEGADAVPREPSFVLPFTWMSVALGGLLVGGGFLDGWAHHHGRLDISLLGATNLSQAYAPPGLPASISSWHVPYVAGIVLSAVLLGAVLVAHRPRGLPWARALPAAYWMSVLGVLMIVLGAVGEVIWPVSFRIGAPDPYRLELGSSGLGAVLSPLRLMELVGLVLIVTGPLRAAWLGAEEGPRRRFAPRPAGRPLPFPLPPLCDA